MSAFDPRGNGPVRFPSFRRSEGELPAVAFDFDRFRFERVYRTTAPVPVVMADLGGLRSFDAEMALRQKAWSLRAHICGYSALAAGIGAFFLLSTDFSGLAFLLVAVLFVAMLVCNGISSRFLKLDLQNRRYELVARLLQRLRKDIAPDEPVTVELDFRPTTDKENLADRGSAGEWKTESFVQRWLTLQVRLMDGTHLRLGMEERLQLRRRTRINPRGKYKTKNKQKGTALLHVQLRVKPEHHPHLARLEARARQAVRLPEYVSLVKLEVAEDRLSLRSGLPLDWEAADRVSPVSCDAPKAAVMSLLSLYQVLNYSTALRKQAPVRVSS